MTDLQLERMMPGAHWARTRVRIKKEQTEQMMYVNVRQLAEYFGVHEQTVRRMAREKTIPAIAVGKQYRFNVEECKEYFASQVLGKAGTGTAGAVPGPVFPTSSAKDN